MNKVIIDKQNTGKTTYLFKRILQSSKEFNNKIVIIDSATEHENKSLLKMVEKRFSDFSVVIDLKDLIYDNSTTIANLDKKLETEILKRPEKFILIDTSYLLEKGYVEYEKTNNPEIFKKFRELYRLSSLQTIKALNRLSLRGDKFYDVFMDEIELPVVSAKSFDYNPKMISYTASVHPENCFQGSFYDQFVKIPKENYRFIDGK